MKRILTATILLMLSFASWADGRKTLIDNDWKFFYGDGSAAVAHPEVADAWRTLDLPHDWSVETEAARVAGGTVIGPFSTNSVGKFQTGNTVGGEGWYMKKLNVQASDLKAASFMLYFEGAYNQTDIYLNGRHLYFNPYGYSSFRFDVTDELHEGENTLLARVRNEGNNTRWYAGSGIYRHVWLLATPKLHADEWDTYVEIRNEDIKIQSGKGTAKVTLHTTVYNEQDGAREGRILVDLLDAKGNSVGSTQQAFSVASWGEQSVSLSLNLSRAELWSTEHPYLYRARIRVEDSTTGTTDVLEKRFGVRRLSFSATSGFRLNNQSTLLQGGCLHHDNGLLGAAAYDRAEDRKLTLVKSQGYNAIRCSHNMPSEHFLDACDSLGLLVIDETFDQWIYQKNNEDYHRFFPEFSDRDLQTMMRRDRNHPCVIAWSIGNEIPGRIEDEGMAAAARMRETVRHYDTTRPVTAAICGWDAGDAWNSASYNWDIQDQRAFQSLDLGGYNYLYDKYEHDHATHPNRVMFGAESFPKHASQNWDKVEQLPYVIGDFVWTAMDYLGEAGIGSAALRANGDQSMFQDWPWFNGWCGDLDIIGQKKPQSYYRDVVWRCAPITMAIERPIPSGMHQSISAWGWQLEQQSWTYPDLKSTDRVTVNVYSRAPRVRLYLNGRRIGEQAPGNTYWTGFSVNYQPGTLRAVNVDASGHELTDESFELRTTGEPVGLRLIADRNTILSDGRDLAYVTIELVDADGQVVTSNSDLKVDLSLTGDGELLAAGSASPNDMESFRSTTPRLYNGRALAILKSNTTAGTIRLTVKAPGMPDAEITITTRTNTSDETAIHAFSSPTEGKAHFFVRDGYIRTTDNSPFVLYNLSGVRMPANRHLTNGIYIVKAGTNIQKVSVK